MIKLFSAFVWLIYGLIYVPAFFIGLIVRVFTFPFDKHNRLTNAIMIFFGSSIITLNPLWKRHYFGLDKITQEKPAFIRVANHQSFLDMPLVATLPMNMKWISKKELFKIPFVGWLMKLSGHISVDRGSKGAAKSLLEMIEPINDGMSVMIFPEGTRSREGKLKPFKKGAFHAAMDNGFRIQPIVIEGTYKCMKPDSWVMNFTGDLYVSVLDPISPDGFGHVNDLRDYVHDVILAESDRLKAIAAENKR